MKAMQRRRRNRQSTAHLEFNRLFRISIYVSSPRMQSEHPSDERDAVIQRGRVLGGLEPSRAFGDARYKWGREVQER
jgi:hypothetical protein